VNGEWRPDLPVFDETALAQFMGIPGSAALCPFYELFIQQALPILDEFRPGQEAQNLQRMEKLAHKLKSSALSVGAEPLGLILAEVERACRSGDQQVLTQLVPQTYALAVRTLDAIAAFQIRLAAPEGNAQTLSD